MLNKIYPDISSASPSAVVIISIAFMLFFGFLTTRITKKLKLPNVTAYIITGILIGPYCLDLIPKETIVGMDFLSDVALAFIAFSTGEFFKLSTLKKNFSRVFIVTIFEAMLSSLFVFVLCYLIFKLSFAFSIVLSALAAATASASTMMTIRQTNSKGVFVDTLLQVIALDNVFALLSYSVAISIATAAISGHSPGIKSIVLPFITNIFVMLLGCGFGFLLKWLLNHRSNDNRLIITVALLFSFCGICSFLEISPLLGCMAIGCIYINTTDDSKLFMQINYFSPPLLLLFFVKSGLSFNLDAIFSANGTTGAFPIIVVGIAYFVTRLIGKYVGAFLGAKASKCNEKVSSYLGLALVPQAGVAIGLAALGARALGGELGSTLQTIILASSILYELVGPPCAKLSLYLSGSYSTKLEELVEVEEVTPGGEQKSSLELLIERIQKIQQEIPHSRIPSDEEQAFTSAAEEHFSAINRQQRRRGIK